MTGAEARRSPVFWMILAAACLACTGLSGVGVHLVPISGDHGVPPSVAAVAMSALALVNLLGQIVMGRLYDGLATPRIAAPTLLVAIAGLPILATATSSDAFVAGGALIGIGAAAEYSFFPYALQRYFGLRAYGEIYGMVFGVTLLAQSCGPLLLSIGRDYTGSYAAGLAGVAIALAIAALLILLLPAYDRHGDQKLLVAPMP